MAKIVLITPYFWPEVAASVPLMTSLAEDLAKAGHQVTVLTMKPTRSLDGYVAAGMRQARFDETRIQVVRIANPFARKTGVAAKLLEYSWFAMGVLVRLLTLRTVDLCFVSSNPPLMSLVVGFLCRLRGAHIIYNLQDLFPESAIAAGLLPCNGPVVALLRRLERRSYASADLVVAISHQFADHVWSVAPNARVAVIPNWVDTDFLRPIPHSQNRFRLSMGFEDEFIVMYAGNMGFLQDLDTVLQAAEILRSLDSIIFVLVGDGQQRDHLEEYVRRAKLTNCRLVTFQPYGLLPHVYSAGDVGLVTMRRGSSGSSIPSKTWNIMACARPVLAAIDSQGELALLIRDIGAGIVVKPSDPEALARAIQQMYEDPSERERMGQAGRLYVDQHLSRSRITAKYEALLQDLGRSSRTSAHGKGLPDATK